MIKHKQAIKRTIQLLFLSILLSALFMSVPARPARANTYNVTNTNNSGAGSLRQAITDAYNNPGADIITFDVAISGIPIVLSGAAGEDLNVSGDLDILDGGDLRIEGNGAANTIIDGGGIDRVFHVCPGGSCANTVTLSDVAIRNGSVAGSGGGIFNLGTLNVQNSTIGWAGLGNTAVSGGGINNAAGTTTVDGSTVSYNTATNGGGIYNAVGTTTVDGSTVRDNTASADGGGIFNVAGTTTVDGSTVSANGATDGGGIYNKGATATLNVQNGSTIGGAGTSNTAGAGWSMDGPVRGNRPSTCETSTKWRSSPTARASSSRSTASSLRTTRKPTPQCPERA